LRTTSWIQQNSAVCELTGYPVEKITKDKLYSISHKLFKVKESLEKHLSHQTNELFDLENKIILYDLTNLDNDYNPGVSLDTMKIGDNNGFIEAEDMYDAYVEGHTVFDLDITNHSYGGQSMRLLSLKQLIIYIKTK